MTLNDVKVSANTMHCHTVRRWDSPPSAGRCWIVWHITRTLVYWRAEERQEKGGRGSMIDPHETHMAHTSGLSAADEVAVYVRIAALMDRAAEHRHACERLKRAYGPTLPTPYQAVYTTHDAAREALDVQIWAWGSALYPDEGAESADELDDTAYGGDAPTAGEAGRIVGHTAATADEMKHVVACADSARIVGYVESDADEPVSWRDEWRAWVVALLLIVGWCGEVALTWR